MQQNVKMKITNTNRYIYTRHMVQNDYIGLPDTTKTPLYEIYSLILWYLDHFYEQRVGLSSHLIQ